MKLARGTWVAALDGSRGIILVNTGTAAAPRFAVHRTLTLDNPPTREQGHERPGRTYASVGNRRSGVEAPDLHQRAEDHFLREIVQGLEADAGAGAFKQLVIAAPPKALAMVRSVMGPALKSRVIAELNRDLTRMTPAEIGEAVSKAVAG